MDIKIEPADELMSENTQENAFKYEIHQNNVYDICYDKKSIEIKVETHVKQEENVETNKVQTNNTDSPNPSKSQSMTWAKNDLSFSPYLSQRNIKNEILPQAKPDAGSSIEPKYDSPISKNADNSCCISMVDKNFVGIKNEALQKHEATIDSQHDFEKFKNTISKLPVTRYPNSTNMTKNQLTSTRYTNEQYVNTKVEAVVTLEMCVFHARNFVCKVCFGIYPSSSSLDRHAALHGTSKFDAEKSEKFSMEIKIEPKDGLHLPKNPFTNKGNQNNVNNFLNEDHTIEIEYKAVDVQKKRIQQTIRRKSRKTVKCDQCNYKTADLGNLKKHKMLHTGDKVYKCDQCGYKSIRSDTLKRHKISHTEEKPFECDQCNYKTALSSHFKTHKMNHTGEKPFKCIECNFETAYSSSLKVHKMSHSRENSCGQGDLDNCEPASLCDSKDIQMTHPEQKTFNCDQCNYKYFYHSHLKVHKMSHTGEKPFMCDQCDYRSARSGNLKKHKMTHTGEKPFKCDRCNYKSAHLDHLKRHSLSHTRKKPFKSD